MSNSVKQLLLPHFTSLSVQVNLFYTVKNIRLFRRLNSQTTYIIHPLAGLCSHIVEVVYTLQFVVFTSWLLRVETASYRSLILLAPLSGIQTQRPNRLKMWLHLITEVKLDFEKNQISSAVCLFTLTNDTVGCGPGLLYRLLPESIWLHFTAHFRDCLTLSKELPTMADYFLLFPQREYKVVFLPLTKSEVC